MPLCCALGTGRPSATVSGSLSVSPSPPAYKGRNGGVAIKVALSQLCGKGQVKRVQDFPSVKKAPAILHILKAG